MDEFGDFCQVLTMPQPPVESLAGPDKTPAMARAVNDGLAELVNKHPKRFIGVWRVPADEQPGRGAEGTGPRGSTLGAKGAQIYTNINNKPLDAAEFQPIFDEMARRKPDDRGCTRPAAPNLPTT